MNDSRRRMADLGPEPEPYITIPDLLLHEALQALDPLAQGQVTTPDQRQAERHRHTTSDVNRGLIVAIIEYAKEGADEGDPSVGIYSNGLGELAYELELLLDGKLVCPECGGEGMNWNEDAFLRETARMASVTGETVEQVRLGGDGPGYIKCPTCDSAGVVRMADVQ